MRARGKQRGFTLVELLMALMVTSVVLGAVATLAYAVGTAHDASDDTSQKQAYVRFATLRISELIRHCKLVCGNPGSDLAVWRADDNDDGKIDIEELVYIEKGAGGGYLRLLDFPTKPDWLSLNITLDDIQGGLVKERLKFFCQERYTYMVSECSNAAFLFDVSGPGSRLVSISFDLFENDITRHYQISAAVRSQTEHLLDADGELITSDDD
jgi:prepilin-type N-terminal cleavage/methylation domain-containing protein